MKVIDLTNISQRRFVQAPVITQEPDVTARGEVIDLTTGNYRRLGRVSMKTLPGGSPKGWGAESYRQAYDSMGGSFNDVATNMSGRMDDPEAFAAWLKYRATGEWPGSAEWKNKSMGMVIDHDEMEKSLRSYLSEKSISIPHPATPGGIAYQDTNSLAVSGSEAPAAVDTTVKSSEGALQLGKDFIIKDADLPFSFVCDINKSYEDNGKWIVEGKASDDRLDKQGDIVSPEAIKSMLEVIKSGSLPLLPDHYADWSDEMGKIFDGEISADNELFIKAELDQANPKAQKLWAALKSGKQLGLSISGAVQKAVQKVVDNGTRIVRVIEQLLLKHIAVTGKPANPRTSLYMAKARTWVTAIANTLNKVEVAR